MKLTSRGPSETEEIGFRLGLRLRPGDIVALFGDLGAGKTTMVKGIARALGVDSGEVVSPSFTIITEYGSSPPLVHVDLYRIAGAGDLEDIGLWECIGGNSIAVLEWAERAEDELPDGTLRVRLTNPGGDDREIAIEGLDEEDRDHLQA